MSDEAKLYISENRLYGISPNLLSTLSIDQLPLTKSFAQSPYDPYSYLYTQNGYMTGTIGYYLAKKFNILGAENS